MCVGEAQQCQRQARRSRASSPSSIHGHHFGCIARSIGCERLETRAKVNAEHRPHRLSHQNLDSQRRALRAAQCKKVYCSASIIVRGNHSTRESWAFKKVQGNECWPTERRHVQFEQMTFGILGTQRRRTHAVPRLACELFS